MNCPFSTCKEAQQQPARKRKHRAHWKLQWKKKDQFKEKKRNAVIVVDRLSLNCSPLDTTQQHLPALTKEHPLIST